MIGEGTVEESDRARRPPPRARMPAVLVRLEGLEVAAGGRTTASRLRSASLTVTAGEIVGVAAVEGNGQRELLRAVAGRLHPLRGRRRGGGAGRLHPRGPHHRGTDSRADADRERGARLRRRRIPGSGAAGWTGASREARTAALLDGAMRSWRPGPDVPAASLSGGNQQKVVVARELARSGRGWSWRRTRRAGSTSGRQPRSTPGSARRRRRAPRCCVYSSDLDEVLALADPGPGGGARRAGRGAAGRDPGRRQLMLAELMVTGGRLGDWSLPARSSLGLLVLAAGLRARGLRLRRRARRALARRVRLLVCPHLRHAGPRRAAHHHRPRASRSPSAAAPQHRRRRTVLRRRHRGDLGRAARRRALPAALAVAAVLSARGARRRRSGWRCRSWLRLRFGVLEVISTLLLNFVAEALVSLMVQGPLQEAQHIYPQSDPIARRRGCRSCPAPASTRDCCSRSLVRGAALVCLRAHALGIPAPRRRAPGPARRRSAGESTAAGSRARGAAGARGAGGAGGRGRGERRVLRAVPEPLARIRLHRHRGGAARAAAPARRRRAPACCSARSRRARARCSGTPACRPWRCTWSRRWCIVVVLLAAVGVRRHGGAS